MYKGPRNGRAAQSVLSSHNESHCEKSAQVPGRVQIHHILDFNLTKNEGQRNKYNHGRMGFLWYIDVMDYSAHISPSDK